MDDQDRYSISTDIIFEALELIDIPRLIEKCQKDWQNFSLCEVNNCVIRLGVIHGEFHWHKHDNEDEFFYVISGLLHIDLGDRTVDLKPGQGLLVSLGTSHRTRAPVRTAILMVEGKGVNPIGD